MTVLIHDSEPDGLRIGLLCIINLILPALCTAVEAVLAIILVERDCLAVELECRTTDTVCITSDRSTEVAWLSHVVVDVVETENDVNHLAVLVRNHDRHETSAEVCDTYLHSIGICQCVECSSLSVLLAHKCLRIES